jgi:hypothetical protein
MAWIHAVLDAPADQHATLASFWSRVLDWPIGAPWPDHNELRSFEPLEGAPYVHLQEIDGPARVHLDLESEDPAATTACAVDLGATLVRETDDWRTLSSPGGFPFCVLEAQPRGAPGPATWPDGHRSRLVQVCIDSPAAAHDREVAFWRALLAERWVPARAPEFAGKWNDDAGSPLQLLFQRLDEPDGPVRAHLDHGTDDLPAEVDRVLDLGAGDIGRGRGWHALRDPAGLAFCVTENSPEQTRHRDIG